MLASLIQALDFVAFSSVGDKSKLPPKALRHHYHASGIHLKAPNRAAYNKYHA